MLISTQKSQPVVPDYELLQRIGRGAYGEVWLARSTATGVLRAAKIVWRDTFEDDRPFQREFEGIQRFERFSHEHPSQIALFHIGRNERDGYFYYVMELADLVERERKGGILGEGSNANSQTAQDSNGSSFHDPPPYIPHTLRTDLQNGRLPAARVLEIGVGRQVVWFDSVTPGVSVEPPVVHHQPLAPVNRPRHRLPYLRFHLGVILR